jgi:glycopeptide antibiotics resistance protein
MDYIVSSADPRINPVYFVIAAIVAILTTVISAYYRKRGKLTTAQSIALTLLTTYIFLVFASTVFSRTPTEDYSYELMPFWSYREIVKGARESHGHVWGESLFWEDIFNVFMLLPIGVLLPIVNGENRKKSLESNKSVEESSVENGVESDVESGVESGVESDVESGVENRSKTGSGRIILIGFLISLTIEILQLVTKRGLFEFDDIFHNTLGVAIGELGYWMIGWKVRSRRSPDEKPVK